VTAAIRILTPDVIRKRFEKLMSGGMDKRIMNACASETVRDIQNHIRGQRAITDSGSFPVNEESTLKRKARAGKAPLSLIDNGGLLRNDVYVKTISDNEAVIALDSGYINSPKGWWWLNSDPPKYHFFGISPTARKKMFETVVRLVRRLALGK
jgi:hypothetical protein